MNARLNDLYGALSYLAKVKYGKALVLTSTDRSCAKQLELSGSQSFHLNGNAFDAVIQPYNASQQKWLGDVAKLLGFRWGGDFHGYNDYVHFDDGLRATPGSCAPVSSPGISRLIAALIPIAGGLLKTKIGTQSGGGGSVETGGNVDVIHEAGGGAIFPSGPLGEEYCRYQRYIGDHTDDEYCEIYDL